MKYDFYIVNKDIYLMGQIIFHTSLVHYGRKVYIYIKWLFLWQKKMIRELCDVADKFLLLDDKDKIKNGQVQAASIRCELNRIAQ